MSHMAILGGGLAGTLAGAAAAPYMDKVTVLERDARDLLDWVLREQALLAAPGSPCAPEHKPSASSATLSASRAYASATASPAPPRSFTPTWSSTRQAAHHGQDTG
jgi:hypothetical protein